MDEKIRTHDYRTRSALVPLVLRDNWTKEMTGISLKAVKITITQKGVKHDTRKGKIAFLHMWESVDHLFST